MDKLRDAAEMVAEVLAPAYAEIPLNGFMWIEGWEVWGEGLKFPGTFLVPRPGPSRMVKVVNTAYEDFINLKIDKDDVLRFASDHGSLRHTGKHFHLDDGTSATGVSWSEWGSEIRRAKQTLHLWFRLMEKDIGWVKKFVEPLGEKGAQWLLQPPVQWPKDHPLDFARAIVVSTINSQLAATLRAAQACGFPGCNFNSSPDNSSHTTAVLRSLKNGSLDLMVTSSDLLKTIWLQIAECVCGKRKLKRCEAPDCRKYMDVTSSDRPGARRMHRACEERLRKRRYRENLEKRKSKKS